MHAKRTEIGNATAALLQGSGFSRRMERQSFKRLPSFRCVASQRMYTVLHSGTHENVYS